MKYKKIIFSIFGSAVSIFLFITFAYAAATVSIQVRETQLRATPDYFGKIIGKAAYGDQVTIENKKAGWKKVRLKNGKSGWINSSALSDKEIRMTAGSKGVRETASASELQLAGKGFNPKVEKEFKQRNKDINFRWVDKMESIKISESEKMNFAKDGGLTLNGGRPWEN